MRIVVLGCGGIGGFLAAKLINAGEDVTVIARGETLKALLGSGLTLTSSLGNIHVAKVKAMARADASTPVDVVLVSVKRWDTFEALRTVDDVVGPETAIISFQNGAQAADEIAHHFSKHNAVGGVCYISARVDVPGHIVHSGALVKFFVGELDSASSKRSSAIAQCFQNSGIACEVSPDIRREMWKKFVFLVGLSATTSSMRAPLGPILADPEARGFLLGILQEVVDVARANGVPMDEGFAEKQLVFMDTLPATMTSSMYADLLLGRRLELPWLSADVAHMGQELKVLTPLNAAVSAILSIHSLGVPAEVANARTPQ